MRRKHLSYSPWRAFILLPIIFSTFSVWAQDRYTISGTVTDQASGEHLIGATVRDLKSGKGTVTNTFGFYSLTLPADSALIAITYIGYKPEAFRVKLTGNVEQNVGMADNSTLKEVEVVAQRYERVEERAQMGRIDIPIQQIKNVPALLGEKDVLKALQLLPGVSGGGEGQSGIYVRGGGPDQNLILLDGVPVYNVSHLFGFISVFTPGKTNFTLILVKKIRNTKTGSNQAWAGAMLPLPCVGTISLTLSCLPIPPLPTVATVSTPKRALKVGIWKTAVWFRRTGLI